MSPLPFERGANSVSMSECCATYNWRNLKPKDFKLGTIININTKMIPIARQVSGSRSLYLQWYHISFVEPCWAYPNHMSMNGVNEKCAVLARKTRATSLWRQKITSKYYEVGQENWHFIFIFPWTQKKDTHSLIQLCCRRGGALVHIHECSKAP